MLQIMYAFLILQYNFESNVELLNLLGQVSSAKPCGFISGTCPHCAPVLS